jgi:CDP-diacylglycerol--glycerol-3-phosphate 3-phosphatidyltransferase
LKFIIISRENKNVLRGIVEARIQPAVTKVASLLNKTGLTPNMLTFTGLGFNAVAAGLYYCGEVAVAGFVILFAGAFDMLDGAVARLGDTASRIGAFTDSVVDRYSDFLIFGGVLCLFARLGDMTGIVLCLLILSGAFLVSYVRARAELVIPLCNVGLMERPERIILLAAGSLFGFLTPALWALAILTHATAFHRIYYTWKNGRATGQKIAETRK